LRKECAKRYLEGMADFNASSFITIAKFPDRNLSAISTS